MSRSPMPLLSALWLTQYVGFAFFIVGLAGSLRDQGVSLERIAVLQVLGLAWALKFLWAPAVDRYSPPGFGHYRSWILVLQPLMAVAILALIPWDVVGDFGLVLVIAGVVVALSATQDIAADALAVRVLRPDQRGVANGIQVASGFVGNLLGGGVTLVVYDVAGWVPAIVVLAFFTVLPLPLVVTFREPVPPDARPSLGRAFAALGGILRRPGVARWSLAVVPLYYAGTNSAFALLTPALVDAGWSLARVGFVLTIAASPFAIVGALATGGVLRATGRRTGLLVAGGVGTATTLLLVPAVTSGTPTLLMGVVTVGLFTLGYTAVNTVVSTVHMDLARLRTPGTDYTVMQSLAITSSLVVAAVIVALAGTLGYTVMFTVCAVLVVTGLGVGIGARALRIGDAGTDEGSGPELSVPAGVTAESLR